jgi:S-adenosyl-L-methionine hydrolase (adenosine-forming)
MNRQLAAVSLFTDFGADDHYIGQMKAVIHSACPDLPVFDLMSGAPAFNAKASGRLLAAILEDLPPSMLILAVIDPGVGSDRHVLLVETEKHLLLAPDNGLLSYVVKHQSVEKILKVKWLPEKLSASFHGRDLFAPLAVKLAHGKDFSTEEMAAEAIVGSEWPEQLDEIIHIDSYGNLITGLKADSMKLTDTVRVDGNLMPFSRTFSDVQVGALIWYENSSGLVEIACNQGSAKAMLSANIGDKVEIVSASAKDWL